MGHRIKAGIYGQKLAAFLSLKALSIAGEAVQAFYDGVLGHVAFLRDLLDCLIARGSAMPAFSEYALQSLDANFELVEIQRRRLNVALRAPESPPPLSFN